MPLSASVTQSLKLRILSCLTKLSDRDTYSLAASELESIARSLDVSSLPIFLSCIYAIDASDKSLVRKQCVRLFAVLSETHGNYLSPYLAKILSNITRRFRDPDSSVRSACVSSVAALASNVTKPPFSTFLKPLTDSLFTEQDSNSQIGAALSLASAIDAAPDPDLLKLGKLLPRFEKLLKCESFKAKAALLTMIGSIIGLDGAFGNGALKNLVPCLVTFLSSEDWAARKSAAEALGKLAVMERDALAEFKAGCLKTFESRRFDKVKAVREAMSQMLEAWKQIPDLSDEASAPYSQSSSKEIASDGRYLPGSKNISSACLDAPLPRKNSSLVGRSTPPDASSATTARRRSALNGGDKKSSLSMFQKVERKKPLDWKVEVSVRKSPSGDLKERDEYIPDRRFSENTKISKPETKRALFNKISDDKIIKFGGFRSGSRVVPCPEEGPESTVVASNTTDDLHRNHKDSEELHLIRNQLNQIEKQQSSLLDILQNFIGSSQNGMRSLETRVHGLELALDEISYDLAASSTGRMSYANTPRITCCMLPGADFFSSWFWKRSNGRGSTPKVSIPSGVTPLAPLRSRGDRHGTNGDAGSINLENHSFQVQPRGGFIVNPLAVRQGESRVVSDASTSLNDLTRRH